MELLLDTNTISEPAKAAPNPIILERLESLAGVYALCAPSWQELVFGIHRLPRSRRRTDLEEYCQAVLAAGIPVLPYDLAAATWHAEERARLMSAGRTPPFVDGQIAAIAVTQGLTLVTANVRDFEAFQGLKLVDWSR